MPKLVTKLPEEKDPCICICFEKIWDARKTNEDLRIKFSKDIYTVRLMPVEQRINLMLIGTDNQRLYKNLEYDYSKLTWWLNYTKDCKKFSFVHIIEEHGKHIMVKTQENNKPFILKVSGYHLVDGLLEIGY